MVSGTSSIEREVKLAGWAGFVLPELTGVFDGVTATPLEPRVLDATYYDTPDLRLARWGVSLRYRSGDGTGWTVKLPEGDDGPALVRREVTFPGPASSVPAEAASLVLALARHEPLAAVARLRTRRNGLDLRDTEGHHLAEVVDDEVTVMEGRRVAARFREVEVELDRRAPKGLLAAVVSALRQAGAGDAEPVPKVVRALGARALAPPDLLLFELGRDPSAGDVVRAAIASSVTRLLRHDPGVRIGDDPEDVHQARVATRRLRSDLRTFKSLVEETWLTPVREELSWLGGLLGGVRDPDVLLERLRRQAAELPEVDAASLAPLLRRLADEREVARSALLEAMAGPRYVALLDSLVKAGRAPALTAEAAAPTGDVLPGLVARPWKHLAKSVADLAADPPDDDLHQVRILAKRCRYAAEAAAPAVGRRASALAKAVADVQGVLGDHQDAVVAEGWLRAAALGGGPEQAFAAGELVAVQRAEAAANRRAWPLAWAQADRKKLRAWLS